MNKSFADCSKCKGNDKIQHVCLSNSKSDLKEVDILYITENSKDQSILEELVITFEDKYLITSLVLCENDILDSETITKCESNWKKFRDVTNPTKIITIGNFDNHQLKDSENYKTVEDFRLSKQVIVTDDDIVLDLSDFANITKPSLNKSISPVTINSSTKELYMYRIDDKFYSDKYRLVDIQYMHFSDQIVYIFRDTDNNKIFYEYERKTDNYYWYESTNNKLIDNVDNLQLVIGNYNSRNKDQFCYESDIKIEVKHAVDYYLQKPIEPLVVNKNILYFDIEIYSYKNTGFPTPEKAEYPINAISFCYDNLDTEMYLLNLSGEIDPMIDEIRKNYSKLTMFNSEITMLKAFFSKVHKLSPDILAGWNIHHFDIPYIVTRMKKLDIPMTVISPYGNVYADPKSGKCIISGYVVLDQMKLYKELTYTNEPSYSLDAIAEKVVGETKERYDGNLNTIYCDNIDKFIKYSFQDTKLLAKIESKVNHIGLQDELRKAATTTHGSAASTIGQADGLFMFSMKSKRLASKNGNHSTVEETLPGAYVFEARGGLYPGVGEKGLLCDFDFASLYPSIINSWNIGPNTFLAKIDPEKMFEYLYEKKNLINKKISIQYDPIHDGKKTEIFCDELDKLISDNNATLNISGCIFKGHDQEESIYYSIIKSLFTNRKINKNLMFEYKQKGDVINTTIYNNKQQSFKILMNSLYGVLGNQHFRFYSNDLARSITLEGQELLKFSAVHCNKYMMNQKDIDCDFMRTVLEPLEYVIYGDTDSIFVDLTSYLKAKKLEPILSKEVESEVKKIQTYLNENIMTDICKRHRVPLDKSMLELKNEYLFSKYYTLSAKKKYATKVIAQEGRPLNFIDVKGLELKRSDFSKITSELLQNVLDMILSDEFNINTVDSYISDITKKVSELASKGDISVAKMVSWSKPLSEYKTLTQNIKAMLMWNELVHEDFRNGSRGYLFPINGIDISKAPEAIKNNYVQKFLKKYKSSDLDAIVVPEDQYNLPEYFIPNIKKIVSFAVTDRTDLLLEPLIKKTHDLLTF